MQKKRLIGVAILAFLALSVFIKTASAEEVLGNDLSIEFREVKDVASEAFAPMELKDAPSQLKDKIYYVSPVVQIGLGDIAILDIFYDPIRDKIGIKMALNEIGREKLENYTSKHINEMLGIVIDGQLCCAPVIKVAITSGSVQTAGAFTPEEAVDIARRFYKIKSILFPLPSPNQRR